MKTEIYQLLPPLANDDLERLKASIAERGVEVPVVVDEDGAIIDGHNRAMIADSLGIEYRRDIRTGLAPHEKRLLAVELNMARRQLTDAQKAQLGRTIEPDIAERSRLRQLATLKQGDKKPRSAQLGGTGETREEVAKAVGLSRSTYQRHKALLEEAEKVAPELIKYVETGDMTMKELNREVEDRKEEAEPEAKSEAAKPTPKSKKVPAVTPVANVPPEVRRMVNMAHDVVDRTRGLLAKHGAARLAEGIEGAIFTGVLEQLRDELYGLAHEIRASSTPPLDSGADRDHPDDRPNVETPPPPFVVEVDCPRCGATVALAGRLVLTPDSGQSGIGCQACGGLAYLAILPAKTG
jgi:ParB-like chromosome segregation protein Spo0J